MKTKRKIVKKTKTLSEKTAAKALHLTKKVRSVVSWTTRTGEEMRIKDMEASHIKNTIVYLYKRQDDYDRYSLDSFEINSMTAMEWIEVFEAELTYRGI